MSGFKSVKFQAQDLRSLLITPERDFLISNTGEEVRLLPVVQKMYVCFSKVKVDELQGKVVCLYFATNVSSQEPSLNSSDESCRSFTIRLTKVYEELKSPDDSFELVLVSCDTDLESFQAHHTEMPWLAVPFSDSATRTKLREEFGVASSPRLVVFDRQGKVANRDAHKLVTEQGSDAFSNLYELPVAETVSESNELPDRLEALFGSSNVLLLRHQLEQVKITDVKQNVLGLFFSAHSSRRARDFTRILITAYKRLEARQEDFEIIFISSDHDLESFGTYYNTMPWLAVPFSDHTTRFNLINRFHVREIPQLIILNASGELVTAQGCSLVQKFGSEAFPFTPSHVSRLPEGRTSWHIDGEGDEEHGRVQGGGGTHVWIINNAQPGFQCSLCNTHGDGWMYICKDCSYGFHPDCGRTGGTRILPDGGEEQVDEQVGLRRSRTIRYPVGPPDTSKKPWSWLGSWIDPEMKRTIIGSAMAGLITVVVGICSFCCSKFGSS